MSVAFKGTLGNSNRRPLSKLEAIALAVGTVSRAFAGEVGELWGERGGGTARTGGRAGGDVAGD